MIGLVRRSYALNATALTLGATVVLECIVVQAPLTSRNRLRSIASGVFGYSVAKYVGAGGILPV